MRRSVLEDITQQRIAAGRPDAEFVSAARSKITNAAEAVKFDCSDSGKGKKQINLYFYRVRFSFLPGRHA